MTDTNTPPAGALPSDSPDTPDPIVFPVGTPISRMPFAPDTGTVDRVDGGSRRVAWVNDDGLEYDWETFTVSELDFLSRGLDPSAKLSYRKGTTAHYQGEVVRIIAEDIDQGTRRIEPISLLSKWAPKTVSINDLTPPPPPLPDPIPFDVGTKAKYEGDVYTVIFAEGRARTIARFPDKSDQWWVTDEKGQRIRNRETVDLDDLKSLTMFDTMNGWQAEPSPTTTSFPVPTTLTPPADPATVDPTQTIAEREMALAQAKAKPFPAGTSAMHLDEPVFITEDEGRSDYRHVVFLEDDKRGLEYVKLSDLRPADTPTSLDDVVYELISRIDNRNDEIDNCVRALRDSQIGAMMLKDEMDLADWAHEIAREKIAQLEAEIADLHHSLQDRLVERERMVTGLLTRQHKAETDILRANAYELQAKVDRLERENEALRLASQVGQTVKRKVETMKLSGPSSEGLAEYINQDWRVVFETIYVRDQEVCHFLRLEREIQDTAHPPLEAEKLQDNPLFSAISLALTVVPQPAPVPDEEPAESKAMKPVLTPVIGARHDDIPDDLPLGEMMRRYVEQYGVTQGAEMVKAAANRQVMREMMAERQAFTERFASLMRQRSVSPFQPIITIDQQP